MLILASSSPRRQELLTRAGFSFVCIPARVDEFFEQGTPPVQVVRELAWRKAITVAREHPRDTILAADTVVALGNEIFGKPRDEAQARLMLRALSGKVHQVYTGWHIVSQGKEQAGEECTLVEFYPLSDSEIDAYVASKEPMDKAGAYGIQGFGALLVRSVTGDYCNVVGLPIARVARVLHGGALF